MSNSTAKIGVVILAAGDGKRMKTGIPKVMNPLHGEPLVSHVVRHVVEAGMSDTPVVVVSANHTLVQDFLKDRATYVIQDKQLGTGHAVACAEPVLAGQVDHVLVVYGDMPLVQGATIKKIIDQHVSAANILTMATVTVPNFEGWWNYFSDFGRIKRDAKGAVIGNIQMKDASPEELQIKEVDPAIFCFKADWLWKNIHTLQPTNAQKELYLTDLIKRAMQQGEKISTVEIDAKQAIGINTKEHLDIAKSL